MSGQTQQFEARCPGGCHSGDFADFDHYCDSAGIKPGEEGQAFAAWMNATSGWDGDAHEIDPDDDPLSDRLPLSDQLWLCWFHIRCWLRRCPECGRRGFYPDAPRWEDDKIAIMLGIAGEGCRRCGKELE